MYASDGACNYSPARAAQKAARARILRRPHGCTVWVSGADAFGLNVVLPEYTAVILWVPALRLEFFRMAVPPASGTVPSEFEPSLNVTAPVTFPAPFKLAVTVAVKVTCWPDTGGLPTTPRRC